MNTKISFEQPKNDHLDWLDKMRKYLNGVVELNEQEIVSHLLPSTCLVLLSNST